MKLDLNAIEKSEKERTKADEKFLRTGLSSLKVDIGQLQRDRAALFQFARDAKSALKALHDHHSLPGDADDSPRYCTIGCEVLAKYFGEEK